LTLLLALSSLAFAPAPFPKSERPVRETQQARQERVLREWRRLDDLGVSWRVVNDDGCDWVRFTFRNGGVGRWRVRDGDLPSALFKVAELVVEDAHR
jgi:hypothetical protein